MASHPSRTRRSEAEAVRTEIDRERRRARRAERVVVQKTTQEIEREVAAIVLREALLL